MLISAFSNLIFYIQGLVQRRIYFHWLLDIHRSGLPVQCSTGKLCYKNRKFKIRTCHLQWLIIWNLGQASMYIFYEAALCVHLLLLHCWQIVGRAGRSNWYVILKKYQFSRFAINRTFYRKRSITIIAWAPAANHAFSCHDDLHWLIRSDTFYNDLFTFISQILSCDIHSFNLRQ